MVILIASSFGALGACFIGAAILLLAFIVGVVAAFLRFRWLSFVSFLACLATAAYLFSEDRHWLAALEHYPKPSVYADEAQQARSDLRSMEYFSIGIGLFLLAGVLMPRRRPLTQNPPA